MFGLKGNTIVNFTFPSGSVTSDAIYMGNSSRCIIDVPAIGDYTGVNSTVFGYLGAPESTGTFRSAVVQTGSGIAKCETLVISGDCSLSFPDITNYPFVKISMRNATISGIMPLQALLSDK